jgi:5,10-methylenetetrahydrofolate reductase
LSFKRIFYEVTPPTKRQTKWELDHTAKNALMNGSTGLDVTDSPTGESHSSAVAASTYLKSVYDAQILCHIRTRDLTKAALRSLVRACDTWGFEAILLIMGEGNESTGLTPSRALSLIREERLVNPKDTVMGLLADPRKIVGVQNKLASKPDFLYSAPITSLDELRTVNELANKGGCDLYAGIMVNSEKNKPIFDRIGLKYDGTQTPMGFAKTVVHHSQSLVIMSPADPVAGLEFLKELRCQL